MRESFEKTLYLSDLDGTLLRSDQTLSAYTCSVIDRLAGVGVHFSFATARSIDTAARVTKGLEMDLPVIVHNGAFIVDSVTRRPLWSAKFTPEEEETVYAAFLRRGLFPLTYAVIDGKNRFPISGKSAEKRSGNLCCRAWGTRTTAARGKFHPPRKRWTATCTILPASATPKNNFPPSMKR